ncbi:MAG: hypothetical protein ACXVBE_15550, partial [Bdellovibrionota bacterium]
FNVPLGQGKYLPHTNTRYVQTKLELSTVLEHVYDYNGETVSKVKHQLSPFLTLSYIPWFSQDSMHPFQQQVNNRTEGLFDQYDIVPQTNSTNFLRYPQGKSIYYGFNSSLVRKMRSLDEMPKAYPYDLVQTAKPKKYPAPLNRKDELATEHQQLWDKYDPHYEQFDEIWDVNVSQAFDFLDAKRHAEDTKRAFSYLLAKSSFHIPHFRHDFEYRFFPRAVPSATETDPTPEARKNKSNFTTSLTWEWEHLTNLRKTRSFVRSMDLNFSSTSFPTYSRTIGGDIIWSINDFVGLKSGYNYDLMAKRQNSWNAMTQITHPSECWGLAFSYDWNQYRQPNKGEVGFQLLLNLMGTGFTGFSRSDSNSSAGVFGGG